MKIEFSLRYTADFDSAEQAKNFLANFAWMLQVGAQAPQYLPAPHTAKLLEESVRVVPDPAPNA